MPDSRTHRGAHPKDAACFAPSGLPVLSRAVDDLSWLMSRGYPHPRSLVLVGDRYTLKERQRKAVARVAAADFEIQRRSEGRVGLDQIKGQRVDLDGYNVLLTVEAAMGGGVLLPARDGTLRDLAAMSRHYKKVEETRDALGFLGEALAGHGAAEVVWYLDRPISNSGRLRKLMLELAEERGWPWIVELVPNPDTILKTSEDVVVSADSAILDAGVRWLNLARLVVETRVPDAWWVDLTRPESER